MLGQWPEGDGDDGARTGWGRDGWTLTGAVMGEPPSVSAIVPPTVASLSRSSLITKGSHEATGILGGRQFLRSKRPRPFTDCH